MQPTRDSRSQGCEKRSSSPPAATLAGSTFSCPLSDAFKSRGPGLAPVLNSQNDPEFRGRLQWRAVARCAALCRAVPRHAAPRPAAQCLERSCHSGPDTFMPNDPGAWNADFVDDRSSGHPNNIFHNANCRRCAEASREKHFACIDSR